MPNPLDMLIGPALRHPQAPRQGENLGSTGTIMSWRGTIGTLAAVGLTIWVIRSVTRAAE
jgi:hypothetical protein